MTTPAKRGRPPGAVPFKAAAPNAQFLTVAQAADRLQCSTKTILRYIWRGQLQAFQLSPPGPYRIAAVSLQKMMDAASNATRKGASNGLETH